MTELRETVAEAIYNAEGAFYGKPYSELPDGGEFDPETGNAATQGYYRYLAHAALEAALIGPRPPREEAGQ